MKIHRFSYYLCASECSRLYICIYIYVYVIFVFSNYLPKNVRYLTIGRRPGLA